jgi:hypothetical protein
VLKEQQSIINHARTRTRTRTYYLPALAGATPLRRDYFRVPSNRNYDSFTPTLTAHSQVNRTEQNEQATHYAYTVPGMDTITLPDTTARSRTEDTANNQSINQSIKYCTSSYCLPYFLKDETTSGLV